MNVIPAGMPETMTQLAIALAPGVSVATSGTPPAGAPSRSSAAVAGVVTIDGISSAGTMVTTRVSTSVAVLFAAFGSPPL
ncbi:hypothetical protein, partial [Phreatobacter sp.]|uniref:hypothetical protein n=1 Tax=Phreatobacter sp. TaxID=1966341 RepID=UPI0025E930E2